MSHGATFGLSEELTDLFTKEASGDGTLACIFVSILDEVFTLGATIPLGASAEADFEATKRLLSEDEATYLLFRRLRGGESQGWAFISFVPDTAPVKQKMLYANAKDTLKKNLPGPTSSVRICTSPTYRTSRWTAPSPATTTLR